MERIYEKIMDALLTGLEINTRDSIEILEIIGTGYSRAEVYIVELKNKSVRKGIYFLKIDEDPEEYNKIDKKFCFSNVTKCLAHQKISGYYVLLLQIAGKSSHDYISFYKINQPQIKQKAIRLMVPELLSEATDKNTLIGNSISPDHLFYKHLGGKLDKNGTLANYLRRTLSCKSPEAVNAVQFENSPEYLLPNAYAFAVDSSLWNRHDLRDTLCCIHGDLHGNNVFISVKDSKYVLIDMALYRTDGYVFYDTGYFELSILLHNLEKVSMDDWLYLIDRISSEDWKNVDCKDKQVLQCIAEQENKWTLQLNDAERLSHTDALKEARLIARILAGLNYAGKRRINDEIRRKAFSYACRYLKQVLQMNSVLYLKESVVIRPWTNIPIDVKANHSDGSDFLNYVDRFNESQRYILVLGDTWNYSTETAEYLARVRWTGVISFRRDRGFEQTLAESNLVRYMEPSDPKTLDLISQNGTWWLYANGIEAKLESIRANISSLNLYT